jgi:two-component system, chemotaxis family, sensor kinase CheA
MGASGAERDRVTIVVVQSGGERPFGLVVDEVLRAEEIVVKPLSRQAQAAGLFGGATVMGDGSAALILDVSQVAKHARLEDAAAEINELAAARIDDEQGDAMRLLTGTVGGKRIAVPIDEIERLEKIDVARIERVGDLQLVAYRDRLLPLVEIADLVGVTAVTAEGGPRRVVVTSESGRYSIGLVVDEVVDAISVPKDAFELLGRAERHGIAGTVSLSEGIAELIDVDAIVAAIDPAALVAAAGASKENAQ